MASPPLITNNHGADVKPSPQISDRAQATSNSVQMPPTTVTTSGPAGPSSPGAPKNIPTSTLNNRSSGFTVLLTGIHQVAAGNSSDKTPIPSDGVNDPERASSNPAEVLKAGYPVSRPEDAPAQANKSTSSSYSQSLSLNIQSAESSEKGEGRHPALGGLPSIATQASAMQIDTDSSPSTSGPGGGATSDGVTTGPVGSSPETPDTAKYLADAMQAYMLHTPLSAHPMSADAVTPTTPGFPLSATTPTTPYPQTSLHTPISAGGRSKHTCTHCNQTFTRHHNLKSHLLTHSHEKPFPCQQCGARFRRLHDLKRHSKLHTGERPHVCEKCGRRFARGDALARHARGEGGCAGRRSSLGAIIDDTLMGGDGTGTEGDEDGMMDEDTPMVGGTDPITPSLEGDSTAVTPDTPTAPSVTTTSTSSGARRPASLPSIKTNVTDNNHLHPHHQPQIQQIPHMQYTYPPMTPARSTAGPSPAGSLFPPTPNHHGKTTPISATSSPLNTRRGASPMSGVTSTSNPSILPGGITESPRAISPAQSTEAISRAKSPLSQFQSSGNKYAPPLTPQSAQAQNPPTSFSSAAPTSHSRQPSQGSAQTRPNQNQQQPPQAPQASMGFPQQPTRPAGAGGSDNPNIFENERGIWDYVKELERRIVELEQKQRTCETFMQQSHQQSLAVAAVAVSQGANTNSTQDGAAGGGGGPGTAGTGP